MPQARSRALCLLFTPLLAFMSSIAAVPTGVRAADTSRLFPETGKSVSGRFLTYWDGHGGLAQQGYPISLEIQEVSDTDGKTYTVQYFERAVFEKHPELAAPNDVLLSLLGVFLYTQKYPNGAPSQEVNTSAGAQLFQATGKHVGGEFLKYWQQHGGLAQQGYPISEEFVEKNDLDGKTYRVQYFERAVFEMHPELQPPYNVLLSQLGTFRYKARYPQPPAGGCSSDIASGTWSGPVHWAFTLTTDTGLQGNGGYDATLQLNVACDGSFTGTATTTTYSAIGTLAGVTVLTCSMTVAPIAEFKGQVITLADGLHLVITDGTWKQGTTSCKSPLSATQTDDLTGKAVGPVNIKPETVEAGKLTGSQFLSDPALDVIKARVQALLPNATVTVQSTGHWELLLK